jgi:hypothetical protein
MNGRLRRPLMALSIVLVLVGLGYGAQSAATADGGLCGSSLHWYFGNPSTTGGEVSLSQRAVADGQCRTSARQHVERGAVALVVGLLLGTATVSQLTSGPSPTGATDRSRWGRSR